MTVSDSDIPLPRGNVYPVLCIGVDDRTVSFAITSSSGTRPPQPSVSGDTIELGGHTFVITDVPGEYLVDGVAFSLSDRGVHVFQDGTYCDAEMINDY